MIMAGLMGVWIPVGLAALHPGTLPQPFAGLADGALRALLVAGLVGSGLRLMKARNVLAQKVAWVLVLAGAVVLPLLTPRAAQVRWLTLRVPAETWFQPIQSGSAGRVDRQVVAPVDRLGAVDTLTARATHAAPKQRVQTEEKSSLAGSRFPAPVIAQRRFDAMPLAGPTIEEHKRLTFGAWAAGMYVLVCLALLFRVGFGLCAATLLWLRAERVPQEALPESSAGLHVRSSEAILSPVTIGSGIILPADYDAWDNDKLRVVLAHERSHVRQRDFYLQLCAGVYTAINWPSPLGWWLKRKLSDLSETISDRAALLESSSHANYAQILLEFAAMPRTNPSRTYLGVAMARPRRLAERIEQLLNETSYRQAFTGSRTRLLITILLVPAVLAGAALVRVQAAVQDVPPAARAASAAIAPNDTQQPAPVAAQNPSAAPAAQEPAAPAAPGAAAVAPPAVPAPPPPMTITVPRTPNPPKMLFMQDLSGSGSGSGSSSGSGMSSNQIITLDRSSTNPPMLILDDGDVQSGLSGHDYSAHSHEKDGEFFGIFQRYGGDVLFSGTRTKGHEDAIEKASKATKDDFILYTGRDGKSYFIDDPHEVAQVEALYSSLDSMNSQQTLLSKLQESFGHEQKQFAERKEQPIVPKPDLQKELSGLNVEIAKLQALNDTNVSEQQLSELQAKLSEMQGKIAQLQFSMNGQAMNWGNMQDQFAKQQKQWVDQLTRLEVKRKALEEEAEMRMKSIIDESLKDGRAKPLQ